METDVVILELANRPGALADAARRLADAGVNIEYSYGSAGAAHDGVLVMRVDDVEKAKAALG